MIHTKTKPGYYDRKDYWIVSYTDRRTNEYVEKRYGDVDNAYEDYCWYYKQWWTQDCEYNHYRDE